MNKIIGKISQVIGPVVDVDFAEGQTPAIYNALQTKAEGAGQSGVLTLEVAKQDRKSVV